MGKHAFMSASQSSWLNYSEDNLLSNYFNQHTTTIGTLCHELAAKLISFGIKLKKQDVGILTFYLLDNRIPKKSIDIQNIWPNFMTYVNDAIGFKLSPEILLYFSDNCFGTADAISFRNNELRIHDLKTGETKIHIEQLLIYSALFCLEYKKQPEKIHIETRIYQSGKDILIYEPDPEEIKIIMNKIIDYDNLIEMNR